MLLCANLFSAAAAAAESLQVAAPTSCTSLYSAAICISWLRLCGCCHVLRISTLSHWVAAPSLAAVASLAAVVAAIDDDHDDNDACLLFCTQFALNISFTLLYISQAADSLIH